SNVVIIFIAIALAETDYGGQSWYPGCIQNPTGGACVWSYQGGAEASGILQEGNAGNPTSAYQTGKFTASAAASMCPGFNANNWESVWFNPLCSFEWAFAYYQSHGGSYGFWAAYNNGHYSSEYQYLVRGICANGTPGKNWCQFSGLTERVTGGGGGNFVVWLDPLLSVSCDGVTGTDSCVYKLDDGNTGYMGVSSCSSTNGKGFQNVNTQSYDYVQGTVFIYMDSSCNVILTGIDNAYITAPERPHPGYDSNACYEYTDGQCGGFDDCAYAGWDSYFANGNQAADCESQGW
ncbi:MAG: hypothetical protein ABSA72_13750, partial [Nitrososphaerales archaeon]